MAAASAAATLARLAADYWDWQMRTSPLYATRVGDYRFDDRLPEIGEAAHTAQRDALGGFRDRLKRLPEAKLSEGDRVTADVLRVALDLALGEHDHRPWEWEVDQLFGPQVWILQLPTFRPLDSEKAVRDCTARCAAFPAYVEDYLGNLRRGIASGRVPWRGAVVRVVGQTRALLASGPERSALGQAARELPAPLATAGAALQRATAEHVFPALSRLAEFLEGTLSPRARVEPPGASGLPGGRELYAWAIRAHTKPGLTAEALHELGQSEVARIRAEMESIAAGRGYRKDLEGFLNSLRADPKNFYASKDDLLADARRLLGAANAQLPKLFGRLPKTPCEIRPIEPHREQDAVAAYYHGPPADGSRPGIYYVNTYKPDTRPRYNMPALSLHEAVPGHHLQIAIASENTGLPDFRRHGHFTAYIEGWALYTERLGMEMGIYTDDLARLGMFTYEAWRACRLVVDTGLHHFGWSRQQGVDFMKQHLALSEAEIANEVDRYIIWPGQALAYKVGQLEILGLRDKAKQALGSRFDLREFHDTILACGAVPLDALGRLVDRWISARAAR